MKSRFLTKSRFKLAMECPTKLFYTGKDRVYANKKADDPFLAALARGGFQVGELAKFYFPEGHEVTSLDHEESVVQTAELLKQPEVTIFEAALQVDNLFVRVDVLRKTKNQVDLIEVKSKSFDPKDPEEFHTKKGELRSDWKGYFYDVAFQTYVAKKALGRVDVVPFLMLADVTAVASTSGLNQKFALIKENGRKRCVVRSEITEADLKPELLRLVDVQRDVDRILKSSNDVGLSFSQQVEVYSRAYLNDEMIPPVLSSACRKCEFFTSEDDSAAGLKSGRDECWQKVLKLKSQELARPRTYEVWKLSACDDLISAGKHFIDQIKDQDIQVKPGQKTGLSQSQRQLLQIQKVRSKDPTPYLDLPEIKSEIQSWKWPLHLIDFETSTVALPFHKGARPYESLAFQFSHHMMTEDGRVVHQGEYLHISQGEFPNFHFLRALKKELEGDEGSVFRYAPHENTILNTIDAQLGRSREPDRDELRKFLRSITHSKKGAVDAWDGDRDMIDLCELVRRFFYHPLMKGSNSLKYVLPAILNESKFLQEKYSRPIYGAGGGIPSLNFRDYTWVVRDPVGKVLDPYKQLPKVFASTEAADLSIQLLYDDEDLANGGAAMTAWAQMQFSEMSERERSALSAALKKYCELDTLAMVMLVEYWRDSVG